MEDTHSQGESDSEDVMDQEDPSNEHQRRRRGSRTLASAMGGKMYRPEFDAHLRDETSSKQLWTLMDTYIDSEESTIEKGIVTHAEYTLGRTRFNIDIRSCYLATALSIRDRLIESWNDTQQIFTAEDHKRVYYMSLEFLMGRMMQNALVNLNLESKYRNALFELGYRLEELYDQEVEPALGNGGLGRLAACFLDSLATLDYPAWGYGIRYDYGIFRQRIYKGYQIEVPDSWLSRLNPWEIDRTDVAYDIPLYGHVETYNDGEVERKRWSPGEFVKAVAYDTPIPGFDTFNTINLRLWRSRPSSEFDFESFSQGDYFKAIERRQRAEYITSVLNPNDDTDSGKELCLKQQYFFCAATIKDVLRRFLKKPRQWEELPNKIAIHLNDTHPSIAIPELLRTLVDEFQLDWKRAWNICLKVFSYTNHTVMPETLERWSVELLGKMLPRHLEIIYFINFMFMQQISSRYKHDPEKLDMMREMSLVEEGDPKKIKMAYLCIVGSHAVNGISALHTNLLITTLFPQFHEYFPAKFSNKTNGVTPRRWVLLANKELAKLYTRRLGSFEWARDLTKLKDLLPLAEDQEFQQEFYEAKYKNKRRLVDWIFKKTGIVVSPDALFDVLVKPIHEFKRQLMDALYMIHRYLAIKAMDPMDRQHVVKRVILVGGKAAPGYQTAKKIIKLINSISDVVNNDPDIGDVMKVVFLPNYNVSAAEIIIPAADLSQQISTAGTEASGTSNMKFVMNGAVIIGTMDGANGEIRQQIGAANMFIFGARVKEVPEIRRRMQSQQEYPVGRRLSIVFDSIIQGLFGNSKELASLVYGLQDGKDTYLLCHDFCSYLEAQENVDQTYKDQRKWMKMAISGALSMGYFSSDRTIQEYAQKIWSLNSVTIPTPAESALTRVRSQPHLGDVLRERVVTFSDGRPYIQRQISSEELAYTLSRSDHLDPNQS